MSDVEWEAEIRLRRNGRCVRIERALGDSAGQAIYAVTNDLEREYWGDLGPGQGGDQP